MFIKELWDYCINHVRQYVIVQLCKSHFRPCIFTTVFKKQTVVDWDFFPFFQQLMAPRPHRDTSVPPLEATVQITSRWSFQEEVEVLPQTEPIDTLTRRELIKEAATRCMISPLVCSCIYLFSTTHWWRHTKNIVLSVWAKLATLTMGWPFWKKSIYVQLQQREIHFIWNFFFVVFSLIFENFTIDN